MQKRRKMPITTNTSSLDSYPSCPETLSHEGQDDATQILLAITDNLDAEKHSSDLRQSCNSSEITSWNQQNMSSFNHRVTRQPLQRVRVKVRERRQILRENGCLQNKSLMTQLDLAAKSELDRPKMVIREQIQNPQSYMTLEVERERVRSKREILLEIINCKQQIAPVMAGTFKKSRLGWRDLGFVKENDQSKQYQSIRRKEFPAFYRDNQKENEQGSATGMRLREQGLATRNAAWGMARVKGRSLKKMFTE